MAVPTYDNLFNPLLTVLHRLGGSGTVSEIDDAVGSILKLSDEDLNLIQRGSYTKLAYRCAWARNYLKRFGLLDNSIRGVWALTAKGRETESVDKNEVKRYVRAFASANELTNAQEEDETGALGDDIQNWEVALLSRVMELTPEAFERLCQRLLRESGFVQVEITGRSGDGGVDGKGIIRIGGLLSFHIIFQCKRYTNSVGASIVRDFRGALVGRADKGLIITTGAFTRDARAEANREGAPPIDLIDGELLIDKMKELGLGVNVSTKEVVEIDGEWFGRI